MVTVGAQQVFSPKDCGQCAEYKKLTHEFEKWTMIPFALVSATLVTGLIVLLVK